MSESKQSAVASAASVADITPRFREAFEKLASEIRGVAEESLVTINLDIPTAVTTTLGVVPRLRAFRERLRRLPEFELRRFDRLEDYALALGYAHGAYLSASAPPRSLEELGDEGVALRETLLSDASALAQRGLLDGSRLSEIGARTGYRNVAFDLLAMVNLFHERWSAIASKTAVSLAELEQAEVLADRLVTAVGTREQTPLALNSMAVDRQRAFTLFVQAYDEVRRAFSYLRWYEGDVDEIAPSLYARGRRRRDEPAGTEEGTQASEVVAATPQSGPAAAPTAAPGLPGGSPFSN